MIKAGSIVLILTKHGSKVTLMVRPAAPSDMGDPPSMKLTRGKVSARDHQTGSLASSVSDEVGDKEI